MFFMLLIENKTSKKTITKNVKNTYFIHVVIYFLIQFIHSSYT